MRTTKASLTGYEEEKENTQIRKQEMPICGLRSGKNCTVWRQEIFCKGILHKEMSHFEKFVTEGNEKEDELAKGGARLDTKGSWRKREQRQCSKKEKRCVQLCSMQPFYIV